MLISAIQKLTLLDYPGHVSCIVFTPGCNFRCGYCHNPEFVLPERIAKIAGSFIPEESFFRFLEQRKGLLDGVVISGGEPTLAPDLIEFMRRVKAMGFLVKLDTNGNRPQVLQKIIDASLVDYIAMDLKSSLRTYKKVVGQGANLEALLQSIHLIQKSGVDYEFRSTLIREIHTSAILKSMATLLRGSKKVYLQRFRPGHTLDPNFGKYHAFDDAEMAEIRQLFAAEVEEVECR